MPAHSLVALVLILWPLAGVAQGTMAPTMEGGSRPVPDPTILTIQAQERAITALRELLDARLKSLEDKMAVARKDSEFVDARVVLRLDGVPALIDDKIGHLEALMLEKFRGVDQQFLGRDTALAAALLAQKTSVTEQQNANAASAAKVETATTKQIDGISATIVANSRATDDKIEGVKALLAQQSKSVDDKVAEIRANVTTITTTLSARSSGQSDLWAILFGAGGLLIGAVAFMDRRRAAPEHPPWPPQYYPPPQNGTSPPPQVAVVPVVPVPVPQS